MDIFSTIIIFILMIIITIAKLNKYLLIRHHTNLFLILQINWKNPLYFQKVHFLLNNIFNLIINSIISSIFYFF